MTKENYHRATGDEKLQGVDYDFYHCLLRGDFKNEILSNLDDWQKKNTKNLKQKSFNKTHNFYIFSVENSKSKLAYGESPQDAFEVLKIRLTEDELMKVNIHNYKKISHVDIHKYNSQLC
jgi:hypothetical protein